jgi:hypothetical protein
MIACFLMGLGIGAVAVMIAVRLIPQPEPTPLIPRVSAVGVDLSGNKSKVLDVHYARLLEGVLKHYRKV